MSTAEYTFRAVDPSADSDDEIAMVVELGNRLQAEMLPDDPPEPLDLVIAARSAIPARVRRFAFRAYDTAGALVGACGAHFDPDHDDNPDIMGLGVDVVPEHRGKGIATRLIADMVELARAEGRTRFICETYDRWPEAEALCRSLGAEPKQHLHVNHLPLAEVDRALLERWVEEAATRSADYELVHWDDAVPDEHLENHMALMLVMNTAPRDDLEVNDFTITAEEMREGEDQWRAVGAQHMTVVARQRSDGAWAGFHDVHRVPGANPKVAWVYSTGVDPAHRGHALGKWLKADMTLRVLDTWSEVTHIRTGNADSNDAMLGINTKMGYRPFFANTVWELPVEKAAAWVDARRLRIQDMG